MERKPRPRKNERIVRQPAKDSPLVRAGRLAGALVAIPLIIMAALVGGTLWLTAQAARPIIWLHRAVKNKRRDKAEVE